MLFHFKKILKIVIKQSIKTLGSVVVRGALHSKVERREFESISECMVFHCTLSPLSVNVSTSRCIHVIPLVFSLYFSPCHSARSFTEVNLHRWCLVFYPSEAAFRASRFRVTAMDRHARRPRCYLLGVFRVPSVVQGNLTL